MKESDRLGLIADNIRAVGRPAEVQGDDLCTWTESTRRRGAGCGPRAITAWRWRSRCWARCPGARVAVDDLACAAVSFPDSPGPCAASAAEVAREGRRDRDRRAVRLGQVEHRAGGGRGARLRPSRFRLALSRGDAGGPAGSRASGPRQATIRSWCSAPRAILRAAEDRGLMLQPDGAGFAAYLEGEPVDAEIRGAEVTARVSAVSAVPVVREWINSRLRAMVRAGRDVVVDGRDIGTVVFPDAELKIFLTASPEARAGRRISQRGNPVDSGRTRGRSRRARRARPGRLQPRGGSAARRRRRGPARHHRRWRSRTRCASSSSWLVPFSDTADRNVPRSATDVSASAETFSSAQLFFVFRYLPERTIVGRAAAKRLRAALVEHAVKSSPRAPPWHRRRVPLEVASLIVESALSRRRFMVAAGARAGIALVTSAPGRSRPWSADGGAGPAMGAELAPAALAASACWSWRRCRGSRSAWCRSGKVWSRGFGRATETPRTQGLRRRRCSRRSRSASRSSPTRPPAGGQRADRSRPAAVRLPPDPGRRQSARCGGSRPPRAEPHDRAPQLAGAAPGRCCRPPSPAPSSAIRATPTSISSAWWRRLTDRPFARFMRDHVLDPLEMKQQQLRLAAAVRRAEGGRPRRAGRSRSTWWAPSAGPGGGAGAGVGQAADRLALRGRGPRGPA